MTVTTVVDTPLGPLTVTGRDDHLTAVSWPPHRADCALGPSPGAPSAQAARKRTGAGAVDEAVGQLTEYFAGDRCHFDVPLDLGSTGPFQRRVLDVTVAIAYGCTRSYGELAAELGEPGLVRAVGGALKHNPIAVIIPCHRVVAADGALTGYGGGPATGGRLDVKRALLEIERGVFQQPLF